MVVGSGTPAQARRFAQEESVTELVTDPTLEAYRRAGMKRGVLRTLGLGAAKNVARALVDGHRQSATKGDPWQQGGVLVVSALDAGGQLLFAKAASSAGDPTDLGAVVAAMRAGRASA